LPSDAASAWTVGAGAVTLAVRLTPKGGRDAVDGVETLADGRRVLKARVRAAPSEGEANLALCRLVAKSLGVAPRDVTLTAGASSRLKTLSVAGDAKMLIARLEKFVALG
jgi:uncharacterized protein YggU (UPF0235/DUF167 family)